MRTLVVGATGALGRPATRLLLERGVAVRALSRHPERAADLVALGAETVAGDLADLGSLARACDGVTFVLDHCGKPAVREYGYRHRGTERISGGPADRVDVSVMVRSPDGKWHSFTSQRYYDARTGLLRRAINGGRTMEIENYPNATIPAGQFRWSPPAGAMKGLG